MASVDLDMCESQPVVDRRRVRHGEESQKVPDFISFGHCILPKSHTHFSHLCQSHFNTSCLYTLTSPQYRRYIQKIITKLQNVKM